MRPEVSRRRHPNRRRRLAGAVGCRALRPHRPLAARPERAGRHVRRAADRRQRRAAPTGARTAHGSRRAFSRRVVRLARRGRPAPRARRADRTRASLALQAAARSGPEGRSSGHQHDAPSPPASRRCRSRNRWLVPVVRSTRRAACRTGRRAAASARARHGLRQVRQTNRRQRRHRCDGTDRARSRAPTLLRAAGAPVASAGSTSQTRRRDRPLRRRRPAGRASAASQQDLAAVVVRARRAERQPHCRFSRRSSPRMSDRSATLAQATREHQPTAEPEDPQRSAPASPTVSAAVVRQPDTPASVGGGVFVAEVARDRCSACLLRVSRSTHRALMRATAPRKCWSRGPSFPRRRSTESRAGPSASGIGESARHHADDA